MSAPNQQYRRKITLVKSSSHKMSLSTSIKTRVLRGNYKRLTPQRKRKCVRENIVQWSRVGILNPYGKCLFSACSPRDVPASWGQCRRRRNYAMVKPKSCGKRLFPSSCICTLIMQSVPLGRKIARFPIRLQLS
jgi:hypothetical protein